MTSPVRFHLGHGAARRTVLELVHGSEGYVSFAQLHARLPSHRHAVDRAVRALAGEGRLQIHEVITTDRLGRPRVGFAVTPPANSAVHRTTLPRFSGGELRRARRRAGVSLVALARALGVGESAVCWWENQPVVPPARGAEILQALSHLRARPESQVGPRTAARLRALRLSAGWSQSRLAATLGVSQSTISNWESGDGLSHENARRVYQTLRANRG